MDLNSPAQEPTQELRVLIVDDEEELRRSLRSFCESHLNEYKFSIYETCDGEEAIQAFRDTKNSRTFDLVLMDVRMPKVSGLEALVEIKKIQPQTFIVVMTAHGNLRDAVEAIKVGAYDYIEKPVELDKLATIVNKAFETQKMVSDLTISRPIFDDDIESEFIGSSKKMTEIFILINKLSHVDTTVLIRGENGTGKELVARAIHQNSHRKHGEFVAINCAAIPAHLIESELFGHEKGAFTGATERKIGLFQVANKGVLFLDEIAELHVDLQAKILHVLGNRKFIPVGGRREVKSNARIIAATNRNLEMMIEQKIFREDLFYRLNIMPIFMPPLRERRHDLEDLIQYILKKTSSRMRGITPEALKIFKSYQWPGNIRELQNLIERAAIVGKSNMIDLDCIPENIRVQALGHVHIDLPSNYTGPLDFDTFRSESEKEFIVNALKASHGKINKTVAQANIPKNTLLRKIKKYNINVKEFF